MPDDPNQSLRHASALLRQPLRTLTFLLVLLAALVPPSLEAQIEDEILIGKVLAVGDGDTFYLRTQDGRELWIALWGVECPDVGQKIGAKARSYAQRTVLGREIGFQMIVPREETERSYGRVVYRGNRDLALDLLRKGFAVWIESVAPQAFEYGEAQQLARDERLGLWKALQPLEEDEEDEEVLPDEAED